MERGAATGVAVADGGGARGGRGSGGLGAQSHAGGQDSEQHRAPIWLALVALVSTSHSFVSTSMHAYAYNPCAIQRFWNEKNGSSGAR